MHVTEAARAKVNLTLSVLGRRADGYHQIESLVTFADVADQVVLQPASQIDVVTTGPFAQDIIGENLLDRTLALLRDLDPDLALGRVELAKNVPVAAGLGGGSSDAAALLRAVRQLNSERARRIDWQTLAARLGADVPACLQNRPAFVWGLGDRLEPLSGEPEHDHLACVLVNPRVPLPTAQVFRALDAAAFRDDRSSPAIPGPFPDLDRLLVYMRSRGNDLQRPAAALLPLISKVEAAVAAQRGCRHAGLSGSGPTCFGIFGSEAESAEAERVLAQASPQWWVVATRLDWPS